jgi:hypothetical protein
MRSYRSRPGIGGNGDRTALAIVGGSWYAFGVQGLSPERSIPDFEATEVTGTDGYAFPIAWSSDGDRVWWFVRIDANRDRVSTNIGVFGPGLIGPLYRPEVPSWV